MPPKRKPPEPVDCQVAVLMCNDITSFMPEFKCVSLLLPCDTEQLGRQMVADAPPNLIVCVVTIMNTGRIRSYEFYCNQADFAFPGTTKPLVLIHALASVILQFRIGETDAKFIIDPDNSIRLEGF